MFLSLMKVEAEHPALRAEINRTGVAIGVLVLMGLFFRTVLDAASAFVPGLDPWRWTFATTLGWALFVMAYALACAKSLSE